MPGSQAAGNRVVNIRPAAQEVLHECGDGTSTQNTAF